jgi:branched-chain amino acid transport system substrate-binding protein
VKTNVIWTLVSTLLILALVLGACAAPTPTPTPTTPTPTAPAPSPQTLKVGFNVTTSWPVGLDFVHSVQMDVDEVNANGGLNIGGTKYLIDLIQDDNKMDEALSKTVAQKEIFQDNVKYMIIDSWCHAAIPICDANKVLTVASPLMVESYSPKYTYIFQGDIPYTTYPAIWPWVAKQYPGKKTWVGAFPDMDIGHFFTDIQGNAAKKAGYTVLEPIFYPPMATDLSSVGTKVKTVNPDIFTAYGGGPQTDSLVVKAARSSGYSGQVVLSSTTPGAVTVGIAGADASEGIISMAWPQEFDLAPNPLAPKFKKDYIAKFGKWDSPETVYSGQWFIMKEGLQKASSIDVDKVASVIASGLKYQCMNGNGQMISRPDLGNNRTVDTVIGDIAMKIIANGQPKQVGIITLAQMLDYCNLMYGSK